MRSHSNQYLSKLIVSDTRPTFQLFAIGASLREVELKNSRRKNQLKNSFTGSSHEPVLKGARGAPALKPVPNKMPL